MLYPFVNKPVGRIFPVLRSPFAKEKVLLIRDDHPRLAVGLVGLQICGNNPDLQTIGGEREVHTRVPGPVGKTNPDIGYLICRQQGTRSGGILSLGPEESADIVRIDRLVFEDELRG